MFTIFIDQRKQAKMQWLQDTNQSNMGNLNNVRRETSRHCRKKKKKYLKAKINEPETNIMIQNIRDMYRGNSEFKNVYQLRNNIVKDEKDDLLTDCHSLLEEQFPSTVERTWV